MKLRALALVTLAITAFATPAFAIVGCKDYVEVTPNTKAVYGGKTTTAGSGPGGGVTMPNLWGDKCDPLPTSYQPYYSFCNAAVTNVVSQSEKVQGNFDPKAFLGNYGDVPDIYTHRKTLLGFPVGPVLNGACGS